MNIASATLLQPDLSAMRTKLSPTTRKIQTIDKKYPHQGAIPKSPHERQAANTTRGQTKARGRVKAMASLAAGRMS
jgi:hypothetical protein